MYTDITRLIRDIEMFKNGIKTVQTPILEEFKRILEEELDGRVEGPLEPFTAEEMRLSRLQGIREYRNRTNCTLKEAVEACNRAHRSHVRTVSTLEKPAGEVNATPTA